MCNVYRRTIVTRSNIPPKWVPFCRTLGIINWVLRSQVLPFWGMYHREVVRTNATPSFPVWLESVDDRLPLGENRRSSLAIAQSPPSLRRDRPERLRPRLSHWFAGEFR